MSNGGPDNMQKTAPVTAVIVNQANEMMLRLSGAPIDVFLELIKELSLVQIAAIVRAAYQGKANHEYLKVLNRLRSNHAATGVWLPYLRILNQIDPRLPLEPAADVENKDAWYYATVMQAAHALYQRQNEEIAYLKRKHPHHQQWADIDTQDMNAQEVTLELLMTRHQQLEALNESIIRTRIKPQSRELILENIGITRIPEALFNDSSLADYWRNLVRFFCSRNQLQQLPAALGNLVALRELYCDYNQLRQLPDNLGNLVALQGLYCNHNQLRQLPATLGNLMALQKLDCRLNQLQQLPAALVDLTALEVLFCSENQLRILPDYFQHQFGEEWCQNTLSGQCPPITQPGILPQYAAATAQCQYADRQETPDAAEAVTSNLAKLKLN